MANIITRTVANQMFSLFDYAYKKGVIDAASVGDDYVCEDFIQRRKDALSYGLLEFSYDMDWREWKFILCRWCVMLKTRRLSSDFIEKVGRPNYLMVILRVAQDFYTLGVREWLEYKNPLPLEIFKTHVRVHWKPSKGQALRKFQQREMIAQAQEFAYERMHVSLQTQDILSPKSYEIFALELWRATRPATRIVIEDDF